MKETRIIGNVDFRATIGLISFYPNRYWFFWFKRYKFVRGFIFRIFGMDINVREGNATEKLIKIWNDSKNGELPKSG